MNNKVEKLDSLISIPIERSEQQTQSRKRITIELINEILETLKEFNVKETAELYDVSTKTVYTIKNHKHSLQRSINIVEEEIQDAVEVVSTKNMDNDSVIVNDSILAVSNNMLDDPKEELHHLVKPFISIGMIKERHNMPTDKYIFKEMSSALMFDYKMQYKMAKENIRRYISFDEYGKPNAGINLYVTGLSCVLASIIKACNELGIDLILSHYNTITKAYYAQPIFNTNNCINLEDFDIYADEVYTYGCMFDDFLKKQDAFMLTMVNADKKRFSTIFTNKALAWQCYIFAIENRTAVNKEIYLDKIRLNNYGKMTIYNSVSKSII